MFLRRQDVRHTFFPDFKRRQNGTLGGKAINRVRGRDLFRNLRSSSARSYGLLPLQRSRGPSTCSCIFFSKFFHPTIHTGLVLNYTTQSFRIPNKKENRRVIFSIAFSCRRKMSCTSRVVERERGRGNEEVYTYVRIRWRRVVL